MSPVPLIELQRRLSIVGHIRMGGEKPERGVGKKLENWRITSPRKPLLEQAAELYGGEITKWQSPTGSEWQLYTEVPELPVLLMPSYSLDIKYELWEGVTKRTRVCDGYEEEISGGACICNEEGVDRCDFYTRLTVALPELDTMLGWRLITRGANAAHEMPMMVDAARALTNAPFVRTILRIEQRRGVVNGQVARYIVPTLDLGVGYAALTAAAATDPLQPALPPAASALEDGSDSANPAGAARTPRRAAEFGPESISPDEARAPAVSEDVASDSEPPAQTKMATAAQKKKLDVLVGQLREANEITTDGLYDAVATRLRDTAGLDLAMTTPDYVDKDGNVHKAIDEEGVTHWAPLRENLKRPEADQLIDWLTKVEQRIAARAPAGDEQEAQEAVPEVEPEEEPQHITVPFNEFPPGY